MKQANVKQFANDWSYEQERRQEKKRHTEFRKMRQSKRTVWQAAE
jgi:hypothetical protein